MQNFLMAILVAILLFLLTAIWVPIKIPLVPITSNVYYNADFFHKIQLRSLTGGIAHLFGISSIGFSWMLQLFRFGWLIILCVQLFRNIPHIPTAILISALFAATDTMYLTNGLIGFIDIAGDFWLILAATAMLSMQGTRPFLCFFVALCSLCFAVFTHEKTLFGCGVILLWALLHYGKRGVILTAIWALVMAAYFMIAWNRVIYGATPDGYLRFFWYSLQHLMGGDFSLIVKSLFSIFSAAGILWLIYAALGISVIRNASHKMQRLRYTLFFLAGWMANFIPIFIAGDIQRVIGGIWLPLFILIVDQARAKHSWFAIPSGDVYWAALLSLQLMVPPIFTVGFTIRPLNKYAYIFLHYMHKAW